MPCQQVASHKMSLLKTLRKNRGMRWYPMLLSPQQPVRCSCNLFYGSMRRIMHSCLIGAHKAKHPVPSNSDYILAVSNRCHHHNCSCSHGIPPLRASSTPSLTAQQFRLDRDVFCSVPGKHSSQTLSTIASVLELARAAGPRREGESSAKCGSTLGGAWGKKRWGRMSATCGPVSRGMLHISGLVVWGSE